ncbi:hypothetical protein [Sedimentibacter sp.]|uniref:hypothetical protein n=1 Tax=Sedimentibacter sp. TaxID=1960295 RepID=UPI0028AD290B|nr:hypothetical protein [Sedimentibacter sp.]
MNEQKTTYKVRKYDVDDFVAEGLKKIRKQIVKVNTQAAFDEDGVYSDTEYEFLRNQIFKLNVIGKILQVDDFKALRKIEDITENIANKADAKNVQPLFYLLLEAMMPEVEAKDDKGLKMILSILWDYIKKHEAYNKEA